VQTVVDRTGWHKGNALAVLWVDNGTAASNICNPGDQGYAPAALTITWTKDYDPDASQDQPKSVIDPRGHLTEQTFDAKGNLLSVRRQLSDTQWSETRYTYADKTVGSATYKGALTQEKSLISGPPESGVWAVTDYDSGAYYPNGQAEKTVTRDVVLSEQEPDVDLTVTQDFDLFGNLETRTDAAGKQTEDNDYDVAGQLTLAKGPSFQATPAGGSATTTRVEKHLLYDPWGHVTESWSESTGESPHTKADWVTTTYDIAGRAYEVRSKLSSGTVSSTQDLGYDGLGRLIQTQDSTVSGLPALTAYDARGNVVAAWAAGACSGSYDLAKATRNVNGDNTPAYDGLGQVLRTALPGTDPTAFTYTDDNRLLRETKPDSTWTEYTYDANGNATQTMTSKSSPNQLTSAVYDYGDRRTSYTDGNNLTTTYSYDLLGRQITAGAGAGTSAFTYNALGWQLKIQDADGFATTRAYDRAGRLTAETSAGYTTAYLYQDMGAGEAGLLAGTRELGAPTRWEQTDTTHITKTGTWSDFAKTEASAGSYGRSASAGATATITFTGTRLDYIAMTGTTPGVVDVKLDGVLKATIDLYSATAEYQVRAWSSGVLAAGSHTVQLIRSTQSLTGEYHVVDAVDVWGTPAREATATYDWFGRQNTAVETTAGTTVKNTSTAFDSLGRVTTSTDAVRNLSHSFTYPADTAGGLTDAQGVGTGSDLVSTTLTIGADGLEASRASDITSSPDIPDVIRSITTRDSAKRVTKATLQTDTSRYLYAHYAFDSAGRTVRQWGPDSGDGSGYLEAARTGQTPTYTYDGLSGLLASENLQLQSVGSAGVITSSYTYTANGRLATASTNGNPSESFTFDPAGNITAAGPASFTYTENRLATMAAGGQTTYFFFDAAKRWRTVQAPTNSQSDPNRTAFTYTGTGRLETYTKYAGGTASVTATNTYDAQGQRTTSVVTQGTLTTTTNFSYEDLKLTRLSAAQSGSGTASWNLTYLYDESGDPYAGVYRSPGSSTTPMVFGMVVTDRGDVVELLDAAGTPFAAYRYDAWGNPQGTGNVGTGIRSTSTGLITSQVATEIAQRQVLRYASYCWDSLDQNDTRVGLYYLSARHYDPVTRQFLSKDLSRNDGEQSAYQYCNGDPVNNVDPSGYWGMPKWLKKTLKVVQKVADVVSFIPIPGVSTIASLVSTGARIAVDAGEGGWARVKQNAKSYALDVALCATGGAGKVLTKGLGVVAKKVGGAALKQAGGVLTDVARAGRRAEAPSTRYYPKKTKPEWHHDEPIYKGGAKGGVQYHLPGSLHQNVSNMWRERYPYGTGKIGALERREFADQVNKKYPYRNYPSRGRLD
jgi:RHS repeat-associated protein